MQLNAGQPIQQSKKGQSVAYEVQLTSFGNVATRVHFVLEADDTEGITLPEDVIIGSTAKGQNNTVSAIIQVTRNDRISEVTVIAQTSALDDPESTGNAPTVSLLDRRRGISGFQALLIPLALLAAAFIARRRA